MISWREKEIHTSRESDRAREREVAGVTHRMK